jgi:hypothetical protein
MSCPWRVAGAIQANDPGSDPHDEPPTCWICDGVGHGYVAGWEYVPGKGDVPVLSGSCPLEDRGSYDLRDCEEEWW